MQIVTGKTGTPHVTSVQDRALNQGLAGRDAYILDTGQKLAPEIYSANEIHIKDGALMVQGCLCTVDNGGYDTVTIANGSQGMKRKDLIVARYTYNGEAQTESMEWAIVQGAPSASTPTVPQIINVGDIQSFDPIVDTAVFVVTLDGVSIVSVETVVPFLNPMFGTTKVLWSGALWLRAGSSQVATLSEPISRQNNGVILIFSGYANGSEYDGAMSTVVIPKAVLSEFPSSSFISDMGTVDFGVNARKSFVFTDTTVSGGTNADYNYASGTKNGITYDNSKFVLRRVLGF